MRGYGMGDASGWPTILGFLLGVIVPGTLAPLLIDSEHWNIYGIGAMLVFGPLGGFLGSLFEKRGSEL